MENKLGLISLILTVLLIGIYVSREFTESQYIDKMNEIKSVKDSLDKHIKHVEMQLKTRDSLLIKNITQSNAIIHEFESKINITDEKYKEYESNSQEIIKELNNLSQQKH